MFLDRTLSRSANSNSAVLKPNPLGTRLLLATGESLSLGFEASGSATIPTRTRSSCCREAGSGNAWSCSRERISVKRFVLVPAVLW